MDKKYTQSDAKRDEALLEHYDENMLFSDYKQTIERMRKNGYEPTANGAPQPTSSFYNEG